MSCGALTACELAAMRDAVEDTLTGTAAVRRNTPGASDGQGGRAASWSTVATVACRLVQSGQQGEITEGDKPTADTRWTVELPYGTDAVPKDRLLVSGVYYEILATNAGETDAVLLLAYCRRLD